MFDRQCLLFYFIGFGILSAVCSADPASKGMDVAEIKLAVEITNRLGVNVFNRIPASGGNVCISPFSLQQAAGVLFAASANETRKELTNACGYPNDMLRVGNSFKALSMVLDVSLDRSKRRAEESDRSDALLHHDVTIFGQAGWTVNEHFREFITESYSANIKMLDFFGNPKGAWDQVDRQSSSAESGNARDDARKARLFDAGLRTGVVIKSGLRLNMCWAQGFDKMNTMAAKFSVDKNRSVDVKMMSALLRCKYKQKAGYAIVAIPLIGGEFQFTLLLPDSIDGAESSRMGVVETMLQESTKLSNGIVKVRIPRFKVDADGVNLIPLFQSLGVKSVFDSAAGADLSEMLQTVDGAKVYVTALRHSASISLDEAGVEGKSETVIDLSVGGLGALPEIRADHPFVFAIQHISSGACLFLGRVVNPK